MLAQPCDGGMTRRMRGCVGNGLGRPTVQIAPWVMRSGHCASLSRGAQRLAPSRRQHHCGNRWKHGYVWRKEEPRHGSQKDGRDGAPKERPCTGGRSDKEETGEDACDGSCRSVNFQNMALRLILQEALKVVECGRSSWSVCQQEAPCGDAEATKNCVRKRRDRRRRSEPKLHGWFTTGLVEHRHLEKLESCA